MTEKIKCEDCKFWCMDSNNLDQGSCVEESPRVFPMPQPQGISFITVWPTTKRSQGCGKAELSDIFLLDKK